MDDQQLLRYSRQIMLAQVEYDGQQRLIDSKALIIGMGGLGSPVAMYLAAAGIGHLVLVDDDKVDLSNLQRQIVHSTADIGIAKTESAKRRLQALNPHINYTLIDRRLSGDDLLQQVRKVDVVIDASDNFASRFQLNDACVQAGVPLVSGAAIRLEGQVSVFLNNGAGPCYRCLYKDEGELSNTCSENGVLAPVVGVIGAVQAVEAIKVLLKTKQTLDGYLLAYDAWHSEWRKMKLKKDPHCPVCGGQNT